MPENTTKDYLSQVKTSLDRVLNKPYHIDLLNEVHVHDDGSDGTRREHRRVCENAHTRILKRLLEFQQDESFPFLDSLIKYIADVSGSNEWKRIIITDPKFVPEADAEYQGNRGRIDLLISENNKYAIIFENKINDAAIQDSQLARYIHNLVARGFKKEQIYIVFLSSDGCEPETQRTWSIGDEDASGEKTRNEFKNRYINLSYRNGVLDWLSLLLERDAEIVSSQPYVQSALGQYIHYLKSKFLLFDDEKNALLRLVEEQFVKEGDTNQRIRAVLAKRAEVKEYYESIRGSGSDYLETAKKTIAVLDEVMKRMLRALIQNIHFEEYTGRPQNNQKIYIGYSFFVNNREYTIYIGSYSYLFVSVFPSAENDSVSLRRDSQESGIWDLFDEHRQKYLYTKISPGKDEQLYDFESACLLMRRALTIINNGE